MNNAEKSARYRARQTARAQAVFAGAEEIELAYFGILDGHHVAIGMDGKRIPLSVPVGAPVAEVPTTKPPRLYSPKGISREPWETNVARIREQGSPHAAILSQVTKMHENATGEKKKIAARFLKLIQSIPDAPDWADQLPDWTEQ